MIVLAPAVIAGWPPVADITMVGRLRISGDSRVRGNGALQARLDQPVICEKIMRPEGLGLEFAIGRHDMHAVGYAALDLSDQFAVKAKLEDGSASRFVRELGVHNFIGPVSEPAGSIDLY